MKRKLANFAIFIFYNDVIKIDKIAKYPFKFIKGSQAQRDELVCALNYRFFRNIADKFKTKDISFDIFQKTLDETVPFPHNVVVKPNKNNGGFLGINVNESLNKVIGYDMSIPKNPFSGEIPLTTADTFMHESAHYFSFMVNPKKVARIAKLYETGLYQKTQEFYNSILYSKKVLSKPKLSEKLDKFLETLKINERIEFLQNSRYRLKDELIAYKEGEKYQSLIQDIHSDKICCKVDSIDYLDYNFNMKIKVLEEKLARELKKHRQL